MPLSGFHIYVFVINDFSNTFLRNYESQKVETWYKHELLVDVSCLPK